MPAGPPDERPHPDAGVEEWLFTCWAADGTTGLISGWRIDRARPGRGWYWCALVAAGRPVLHVAEWQVPSRSDPLLVKAPGLWAEHTCDVPMRQWTVANETYAIALDDADDALGRAYGTPTAIALDLEWYAVGEPDDVPGRVAPGDSVGPHGGYVQDGVVHGVVELPSGPLHLTEVPARRWHRWGDALDPVDVPPAYAHTGLRAPFAFPDGTTADWVLTRDGWRTRRAERPGLTAPGARRPAPVR